ncbi:MAG: DUF4244 domain-containing protein [Candidatus Nanopelagicales bacterium]|nr:DUF4244 domain-containing protein [Candidatus Nanopelagicales bacterium]MDZ4248713.1 DUF4244 domain-containing protein [Candidatus Nanopelagicales bacterium]MDZ7578580.1 DUF4244 domain-containing protein [Candidatus Nanopelagicales bacterium]
MSGVIARIRQEETGLSTAEYAVGTVAVAGLGGLLLKLLTSDWFLELLRRIIEWAFHSLFA